jgi:hypothetical protein
MAAILGKFPTLSLSAQVVPSDSLSVTDSTTTAVEEVEPIVTEIRVRKTET